MAQNAPLEKHTAAANSAYSVNRANEILDVIMSYARLEFKNKITISEQQDVFDGISAGVNMLGEELENSTISLKEKEQLLKEVHHRVKNNLQIISSLLNLQSEHSQDEKFLMMIRESKNRISSMALIHEMLYTSKDFSQVNINAYITKLSQSIYQSFYMAESNVSFEYAIDTTLFFEIDRMIPIGLILNEIISNSLKYAFPAKQGLISIEFFKTGETYTLIVKDNGTGVPADFDFKTSKSLGIQLIHMLSEQLDGSLVFGNENGTRYKLCF
jgi:two-component sensor histidine kinase